MRNISIPPITNSITANQFLLGIMFNQATKAERAWAAPAIVMERLGTTNLKHICTLSIEQMENAIGLYPAVHPFIHVMSNYFLQCCQVLLRDYDGDARNIWSPPQDVSTLIIKLTQFPGIGKHKALVGIFFLTVEMGITVYDDGYIISIERECPALATIYSPLNKALLTQKPFKQGF